MKRPFLVLTSLAATGGFGYWLVRTPNTQREILLACGGWVLGFWVAAAIQSRRRGRADRLAEDEEAAYDAWDEEDREDEDWEEETQTGDDFADDGEHDEADWDEADDDPDESGRRG